MPANPSSDLPQALGPMRPNAAHARAAFVARCVRRALGTDSSHRDEVPEAGRRGEEFRR